jgi:argininosuccinate synthase
VQHLIGERVYLYWNIHKNVWSISKNGSKVEGYAETVEIEDVELRVRQGGHERAKREGRKNVHAFAIGRLVSINGQQPQQEPKAIVSYNHKKGSSFYDKRTGEPIQYIERAFADNKLLYPI